MCGPVVDLMARSPDLHDQDLGRQWQDIHDRMPVILNADERHAWLSGSDDLDLGAETRLRHHLVRPFGIGDDGPDLIEPFAAPAG